MHMFNSVIDAFKKAEALEHQKNHFIPYRISSKMTKIQFFQFLVFNLLCGLSAKISVRPDKIQSAEIRHVSSRKI